MPRTPNGSSPSSSDGRGRTIVRVALAAWALFVFAAYWTFRMPGAQ